MQIILNKERAGIMIGQVAVGLMAFPWIDIFRNESKYSVSFWEWLICKPFIFFNSNNAKCVQFRFMWFIIQVTAMNSHERSFE